MEKKFFQSWTFLKKTQIDLRIELSETKEEIVAFCLGCGKDITREPGSACDCESTTRDWIIAPFDFHYEEPLSFERFPSNLILISPVENTAIWQESCVLDEKDPYHVYELF